MSPNIRALEIAKLKYRNARYKAVGTLISNTLSCKDKKERKKRSVWVRSWIANRPIYGHYHQLMNELEASDGKAFKGFLRVSPELFHEIVGCVGPRIKKQDTCFRRALDPGLKVAITLRFLATGESYHSLAYGFRVPHNTISLFVPETCQAIIDEYMGEVMKCPQTPEEWKEVAREFGEKWNFWNCCGAVDGKHVAVRKPPGTGSLYFNYKKYFSIVLMAVADANYRFVFVDIGAQGGQSDGGVFRDCNLAEALEGNFAGLPSAEPLPGDDNPFPFFLIGDDAFALRTWLMKPYPFRGLDVPQRTFNYRLSRARHVVENAFGILANR